MNTAILFSSEFVLRDDHITDCLNNDNIPQIVKNYIQTVEDRYTQAMNDLNSVTESLSLAKQRHADDIEAIGNALIEEADERDWCSIYDSFVEKLNRKLFIDLPTREREYEVEVTALVTFRMTTTATTEDQAVDVAAEDVRYFDGRTFGEIEVTDVSISSTHAELC